MIISVINMADGAVSDADLQRAIRAVNRQISDDFAPYWGYGAQLRLEGKSGRARGRSPIDPADMRGDAILYVRNVVRATDVDGYPDRHFSGIPYGVVFLELSKILKEEWTVTLSHEALELTGDPENNLLVQGPHPKNFVLPLYFTSSNERGGRNDFLGTSTKGKTLRSFSVNPGGYIGFFDPAVRDDVTWSLDDDSKGTHRLAAKHKFRAGRGVRRRRPLMA
jgi:hypothetical protein